MPELPAVLRRTLPAFDQAVLTAAAEGGPDLVRKTVDGIRSLEHAEETIARVRRSAAVVIERTRERNGTAPDVVVAALEAAGVPAEEAGTMLADGEGAGEERIPEREPPPLPPAPEPSGATVRSSRGVAVHPASAEGREAARLRRDRVEELLRERPRSIKALAVELGEDVKRVRRTLQALGDDGRAMATLEYAYDWPGAEPGKGRSSVVWSTKDFVEHDDADVLADAAVLRARLGDRLAGDDGDELGRSPVVVGTREIAGVVEHLGVVQDRVLGEPEPAVDAQEAVLVAPIEAPAIQDPVQGRLDPAAARSLLARCAASRREHERLAREVADFAAEFVAAVDGELPEELLRARYLAALLKRIEAGDASDGLLDRFERLAGLTAER